VFASRKQTCSNRHSQRRHFQAMATGR